ncbi:MAG: hypothetical protein K8S56_04515 [Candidatus Cloacimonetes bacterium]|nr:hypothetical protein [Candidatus Cloacimonadota bacterium]
MDKFEQEMMQMNMPEVSTENHQETLKKQIMSLYTQREVRYRKMFRFATSFACLVMALTFWLIADPALACRLNNFAFDSCKLETEVTSVAPVVIDYTSIQNPKIENLIPTEKFLENSIYVIRTYTSSEEEQLLLISEYQNQNEQKPIEKQSF